MAAVCDVGTVGFVLTLGHHTMAVYVIIGLMTVVYVPYSAYGFSSFIFPEARVQVQSAL
jgi:hypothetical protein